MVNFVNFQIGLNFEQGLISGLERDGLQGIDTDVVITVGEN